MKWGVCVAVLAAALCAKAGYARADERVIMPYTCAVQGGRVVMTPAPETGYRILGRHEQQQYTACPHGSPDRCTTWMLHRFDIMCGSVRVAWMHAVEAAMQNVDSRVRVAQGRLHVSLRQPPVSREPCPTAIAWSGTGAVAGSIARRSGGSDCGSAADSSADPLIALPTGYAPVMRVGARFATGRSAAADMRTPAAGMQTEPAIGAGDAGRPLVHPVAQPGSAAADSAGALVLTGWVTQTHAEPRGEEMAARLRKAAGGAIGARPLTLSWMSAVPAVLMLLSLAALAWLRQQAQSATPFAFAGLWDRVVAPLRRRASASDHTAATEAAQRCADLIRASDRLQQVVHAAVAQLPLRPLRDVLERELAGIARILMSPELTRYSAARQWDRVEAMIRRVRVDLERIHRIATSASTLPPGMRDPDTVPRTPAEARDVLGVSSVADERIVKKVVDALRQSWHPDHAADAGDRRAREQRLKQINVAWDLISGRQAAAA